MARSRDVILLAALMAGASVASGAASPAPLLPAVEAGPVPAQYQNERTYYGYGRPPPRQVCWTQYQRVYVGYDQWGRRVYRNVPRRVCGWR